MARLSVVRLSKINLLGCLWKNLVMLEIFLMFLFMLMVNIVVRIFISLYIIFLVNNLVVCSCLIVEFWEFFIFIWFIYKREINGICLFLVGLGLFGLVNFSMEGVGYYLLKYIGWWKLYFLIKVLIFFLCFFLVDL